MRPVSGPTLVVAALLTSPALAGAATGTLPLDVALTRYLLVVGLCWVLLAAAAEWLWAEPGTVAPGEPSPGSVPEADRQATDPAPRDPDPA
jgi:hypothetical protein